ncbi:outer membrane protein [Acetobacter malorum]|uniref:Outer membrane protein n=1 Tax=Acetobacter malorum TaxID=178901 RepID=A0A177G4S2_9PROT|nr:Hint domain-containing protein [Acetobacter malorum]OAG75302.1 outer membrane protein [Acetobacter malorum]
MTSMVISSGVTSDGGGNTSSYDQTAIYGTATNYVFDTSNLNVLSGGAITSSTVMKGNFSASSGSLIEDVTFTGAATYNIKGSAQDVTLLSAGILLVSGTATNATVSGGGQAQIVGSASNLTIQSLNSGNQVALGYISSGSVVSGLQVSGYAGAYASSGSTVSGVTLGGGNGATGNLSAYNGANIYDVVVHSGGVYRPTAYTNSVTVDGGQVVLSSGSVTDVVNDETGQTAKSTVSALSGATVGSATVDGWSKFYISGGTVSSLTASNVTSNGDSVLMDGGVVSSAQIQAAGSISATNSASIQSATVSGSGAYVTVQNGAGLSNGTVAAGGTVNISSGGQVSSTTFTSGATINVYAGGEYDSAIASGVVLNANGGTTSGAIVMSSGTENVLSQGQSVSTTVQSGGSEVVSAGGQSLGDTIQRGGTLVVQTGGTASGATVSGGIVNVSGGVISGVTASSGTINVRSGSAVGDTLYNSGTSEVVYANATTTGTTVISGATQTIVAGATASNTTVSGGTVIIGNQGSLNNASVAGTDTSSGVVNGNVSGLLKGSIAINSGGTLNGGVVVSKATVNVNSGGLASGTVISNNAGTIAFNSGGTGSSISAIVAGSDIPKIVVNSGATVTSDYLSGAAAVEQLSGGTASNTTLVSAGQDIRSGIAYYTSATGSKGNVTLEGAGASAYAATVDSGAKIAVKTGALASGSVINNGGSLQVNGGTASSTTVTGPTASALVASGAVINATVTSSGMISAASATTLSNVTLVSGGSGYVNGSNIAGTVSSGGTLNVLSTGVDLNTTVSNGGTEIISAGGSAVGTTVAGGTIYLSDGGYLSGFSSGVAGDVNVAGDGTTSGKVYAGSSGNLAGTISIGSGGELYGGVMVNSAIVGVNGFASGTVVSNQGFITVFNGATASALSAIAPGSGIPRIVVAKGGTVTSDYLSGANAVEQVTGNAYGTTLVSAGQDVAAGGKVYNTSATGAQANITLQPGATSYSGTVANGAKIHVSVQATANDSVIASGGILNVDSQGTLGGITTLEKGGSATLFKDAGGTIVMNGSDNTGVVISGLSDNSSDVTISTVFSSFDGTSGGNSDGIELAGLKNADVTSVSYPSDDQVKLTLAKGGSVTLNIANVKSQGFSLETAANGDVIYEVCFLAGSMIRTPSGNVAVEGLNIGDSVMTWDWKAQTAVERAVTWTGRKSMQVKTDLADDEAGYPVRILKNAIADGMPSEDLLVTPEHCLFFENTFVPVRMLVNGRSIFYDRSITSYDYFHIETEEHSIIWANNTLTESYLDTGNRSTFRQDGDVVRFVPHAPRKTWENHGAACLSVERGVVEPLFNTLAERAAQSGLPTQAEAHDLTQNPDIHLITTQGQIIRPIRDVMGKVTFIVAADLDAVQIVTRTSRPSQTVGPFVDDRRHLGVLVGQVSLFDGKTEHAITAHLDQSDLDGWDAQEALPHRWTNGNATLPLPAASQNGLRMLSIQVVAAGPYVVQKPSNQSYNLQVAG